MTGDLTAAEIEQYADGEVTTDTARDHVRECARCAGAVLEVMQMKRAIARLQQHRSLSGGPRSSAANAAGDGGAPLRMWLAAAAAIVLFIAGGYLAAARNAARELVDLHTTIVGSSSPVDVLSTDKHTVKPWFEGRVPFAVDVPDLQATDFRLAGGRVVFWRGAPVAYLLVTKGAHRISIFISEMDIAPRLFRSPVTIASWRRNGLTYTAVADVPATDLQRLRDAFLRQP